MKTKTKEGAEQLPDSEIMSLTLKALGITANRLAEETGYKSHSSIYHILNGENKITLEMAKKITTVYPQVNFQFLVLGKKPILTNNKNNLFFETQPKMEDIPKILSDIRDLLFEINSKM